MPPVPLDQAFDQFVEELAAELDAAGLVVTDDPQALNPPCVLVGPPESTYPRLAGSSVAHLAIPVYLLAAPPGDAAANRWLLAYEAPVVAALGATGMAPVVYNGALPGRMTTVRVVATADASDATTELVDLEPFRPDDLLDA